MSEYQEFTGKTVEEALKNAREEFDVGGLTDLDFEILTQGSRGVLGMGADFIIMPFGEVAMDVDRISDLVAIRQMFSSEGERLP